MNKIGLRISVTANMIEAVTSIRANNLLFYVTDCGFTPPHLTKEQLQTTN